MLGTVRALGSFVPEDRSPVDFSEEAVISASARFREQVHIVGDPASGRVGIAFGGSISAPAAGRHVALASVPPVYPEWLGGLEFPEAHGIRFPYVTGAMAHGIASRSLVNAMGRAGMLGFFGSAGLPLPRVEESVAGIAEDLRGTGASWGANLIHSPTEPEIEERTVDIYLRHSVNRVCASAFMRLTPAVVRYACTGLSVAPGGGIQRRNHLFAKLSRSEVARLFMSPAPPDMLSELVRRRALSGEEARLAAHVPLAEDITVEADSGGHTDNRPLGVLLPATLALRQELQDRHRYPRRIRIGAAGGIGTPQSVAGAFALGAAYVLTGSINQATLEAGTSDTVKEMLAGAEPTDVAMAPSPDMFELGVKVQVMKRGTLFASRAAQLYELYRAYERLEDLPEDVVARLEREIFRRPLPDVWSETRRFFAARDPRQIERAERDPKHRMALVYRWYLGLTSRWAIEGHPGRVLDYQIWCGPAMGSFNRWVRGTFLADPRGRTAVQVARNLLEGAAVITRAQQLRSFGVDVPDAAFQYTPRHLV